jgi:hypothetical protein
MLLGCWLERASGPAIHSLFGAQLVITGFEAQYCRDERFFIIRNSDTTQINSKARKSPYMSLVLHYSLQLSKIASPVVLTWSIDD